LYEGEPINKHCAINQFVDIEFSNAPRCTERFLTVADRRDSNVILIYKLPPGSLILAGLRQVSGRHVLNFDIPVSRLV